jgi:hypothetical protein
MIVEHLEAYEIALIIWSFLFGLLGLQGFVSIYLEGEVDEPRVQPAPGAPWRVVAFMVLLTAANVWLAWQFVQGLFQGVPNTSLARTAALILIVLAALIGLYRRYFIDDVVIAQDRDDGVPW